MNIVINDIKEDRSLESRVNGTIVTRLLKKLATNAVNPPVVLWKAKVDLIGRDWIT